MFKNEKSERKSYALDLSQLLYRKHTKITIQNEFALQQRECILLRLIFPHACEVNVSEQNEEKNTGD